MAVPVTHRRVILCSLSNLTPGAPQLQVLQLPKQVRVNAVAPPVFDPAYVEKRSFPQLVELLVAGAREQPPESVKLF